MIPSLNASSTCKGAQSAPVSAKASARFAAQMRGQHVRSAHQPPVATAPTRHISCAATTEAAAPLSTSDQQGTRDDAVMRDMINFLRQEMPAIFTQGKVSTEKYAEGVYFEDPLSRWNSVRGYQLMISSLTTLFRNTFDLHDIATISEDTIRARWTLTMNFRLLPWQPQAIFTGISDYTVDRSTGLITRHVDVWDALSDSSFISLEGLQYVLGSLGSVQLTPDLETPDYQVLYKNKSYEVRQYEGYNVAETPMPRGAGPAAGGAFPELAGYLFGGNDRAESMSMTTPVLNTVSPRGGGGAGAAGSAAPAPDAAPVDAPAAPPSAAIGDAETSREDRMQFVMGKGTPLESLPAPKQGSIRTRAERGKICAARRFSGLPSDREVEEAEKALRDALAANGVAAAEGYTLARYNEPYVLPPLRRNEVLIELPEWQLPPVK